MIVNGDCQAIFNNLIKKTRIYFILFSIKHDTKADLCSINQKLDGLTEILLIIYCCSVIIGNKQIGFKNKK